MTVATQKRMSLQEFLTYDDGTDARYELVDGVLVAMGAESTGNLQIAMLLIETFLQLVGRQRVGIKQKIEVKSAFATARDADLVIHSVGSRLAIKGRSEACLFRDEPNPLIVIEIVSPGSESTENYQRDYEQKPKEYAARGIPEMWQIDLARAWVRVGSLVDGAYQFQDFTGNCVIVSPTFPGLTLTAEQVLTADE
jgi:Uma2 family endonuclease